MDSSSWVHFNTQSTKRKRADLACQICHSKKTKCDLQDRAAEGFESCSYCAASKRNCRPRQSKRQRRQQQKPTSLEDWSLTPSTTNAAEGNDGDITTAEPYRNPVPASDARNELNVTRTRFASPQQVVSEVPNPPSSSADVAVVHTNESSLITPRQLHLNAKNDLAPTGDSPLSSSNTRNGYAEGFTVDTGFLRVYEPENRTDAITQQLAIQENRMMKAASLDTSTLVPSSDLLQGFIETYFQHCYAFCPVLDKHTVDSDLAHSPLLSNAVAIVGSHIRPPLIPHSDPAIYYDRAKQLFYNDDETNVMTCLKAICLFYWWSPRPPTAIHRHSSWWWQSVVIRHAQQMGMHREPPSNHPRYSELDMPLRRKVWWTAFARERLTALCQSRPAIIDPDDCNIQMPSLDDFAGVEPTLKKKAEVFVYWVRLCATIGKITKYLSHNSNNSSAAFPTELANELISWIASLPPNLRLPIEAPYTASFDYDVYQLHLPYLATIIVLHLKSSSPSLPDAGSPAILAATCVARILKDVLTRGSARTLMAITCWYTGISFLALLAASKRSELKVGAAEDLDILTLTVKQLKLMWPTAKIFEQGFERLRANFVTENDLSHEAVEPVGPEPNSGIESVDWIKYFPFVTPSTSKVAEQLLRDREQQTLQLYEFAAPQLMMSYLQEFFEPDDSMNFLDLPLFS